MNQEELLERKCFDFAEKLNELAQEAGPDSRSWQMRQLHFAAVKTGVFVRKSLMHDSKREHNQHMLQACVHALESQYWLQLLSHGEKANGLVAGALQKIQDILSLLTTILKLKNYNPNY